MNFQLNEPDQFGNYWLGKHSGRTAGPAIFTGKRIIGDDKVVHDGTYFLFLDCDRGFVWNNDLTLRRYATPQAALKELNRLFWETGKC